MGKIAVVLAAIELLSRANAGQILSWDNCVLIAARNNADLQSAASTFEAAEHQTGAARADFLPQVTGNVGATRGTGLGSSSNYSASLTGTQNLFNGLQDLGQLRQTKAQARASAAAMRATQARVSFDLKSAFESLRYAKEAEQLTREIVHRREENLKLVELRFESGRENKGSLLLSEAYLEQAKYDDLQAHNDERVARAQLARALGLNDFEDYDIEGAIPVTPPAAFDPNFKRLAVKTPEYEQARAQEEAADAGITVARSAFFPTLALTAAGSRQEQNFFPSENDRWSMTLSLTLPLFSGGHDYYSTRAAVASWSASAAAVANASRLALARLEQAFSNYEIAVAKQAVDASFVRASKLQAEISRKKYNNGLMSFEDWDRIENDLITRQKGALVSKRDRVISEAAWEQAQGKGVFHD